MPGVNENIVREYFESLGFVVGQPCKYIGHGKQRKAEEDLHLLVYNPLVTEQRLPESIVWTTEDLRGITRGVVAVLGWHSERFSSARFLKTPEILAFAKEAAVNAAVRRLGSPDIAKILCLAALPASGELTRTTLLMLKEQGISGVILFSTILRHLMAVVDKTKNYEKSDLLQTIRILKSYNLLKDGQMDFFDRKRRHKQSRKA